MKCFWIGERTEIFIGKCPQDICDHYKLKCKSESMREEYELMQADIKNNNFGEITDMNSIVIFSDNSEADEGIITIGELIKDSSTVRQIASAYC